MLTKTVGRLAAALLVFLGLMLVGLPDLVVQEAEAGVEAWTAGSRSIQSSQRAMAKWDSVNWSSTDTSETSGNRKVLFMAGSGADTSAAFDFRWVESAILYVERDSTGAMGSKLALADSIYLEASPDGATFKRVSSTPVWSSATSADATALVLLFSSRIDSNLWGGGEVQRLLSGTPLIRFTAGWSHGSPDTSKVKLIFSRRELLR